MKKSLLLISILTLLLLSIVVSCKSTPPADSFTPAPSALASVEEARQKAIDFEAPAYFPSEWEAAEALYAEATSATGSEAQNAYNAAANAYEELFKSSVPLYAQAREDEIMAIREEIKASGFSDAYPQYLRGADEISLQAKAEYDAEDYYAAKDTVVLAMNEYSTILLGARAYQTRREIIDRDFASYDQENFDKADEAGALAMSKYDEGDKEGAVESAEEALLRYNIALENGWTQYAITRQESARKERELALEEKANIASREIFREADALFNQAEDALSKENYRNAGIQYIDAEALFAVSRRDTEEKRLRAEEAIKLAEEKIEESDEAASAAERIIEGGSR